MHENEIIDLALSFIKKHTGLLLNCCPYFGGLQVHQTKIFFNVEVDTPCFDCVELKKLTIISGVKKTIRSVEPNGYKRLAVFIDLERLKAT